jgi:hypothetical protein
MSFFMMQGSHQVPTTPVDNFAFASDPAIVTARYVRGMQQEGVRCGTAGGRERGFPQKLFQVGYSTQILHFFGKAYSHDTPLADAITAKQSYRLESTLH